MIRLTSYVIIKKEIEFNGTPVYKAYWRGTDNRVKKDNGLNVQAYSKKRDLIFEIKNNPMERGVIINE